MIHHTDHASDRARERYGLEPTEAEWACVILDITDAVAGKGLAALLLRRYDDGAELWGVRLAGQCMKLVYDPRLALIITVLPSDA